MKTSLKHDTVENISESYDIRGDRFTITAPQAYRNGKPVFNEVLDTIATNRAFDTYRLRHHYLMPEDLRNLDQYFAARHIDLAKLVGVTDFTFRGYLNGCLQSTNVERAIEHLVKHLN